MNEQGIKMFTLTNDVKGSELVQNLPLFSSDNKYLIIDVPLISQTDADFLIGLQLEGLKNSQLRGENSLLIEIQPSNKTTTWFTDFSNVYYDVEPELT